MLHRRLNRELDILMDKYNLNLYIDYHNSGATITIFLRDIDKFCVIKYNKDYPFRPCSVFLIINNKEINYIDYFKNKHKKILNYCRESSLPYACPCCFNLYCKWDVSNTSSNMLDEVIVKYKTYNKLELRLYVFMTLIKLFNEKYLKKIDNIILHIIKYI